MKKLFITEAPSVEGYEGATLRYKNTVSVLWDMWYSAPAENEKGDKYIVYWACTKDFIEMSEEEQSNNEDIACDWEKPWLIEKAESDPWGEQEDINENEVELNWERAY